MHGPLTTQAKQRIIDAAVFVVAEDDTHVLLGLCNIELLARVVLEMAFDIFGIDALQPGNLDVINDRWLAHARWRRLRQPRLVLFFVDTELLKLRQCRLGGGPTALGGFVIALEVAGGDAVEVGLDIDYRYHPA